MMPRLFVCVTCLLLDAGEASAGAQQVRDPRTSVVAALATRDEGVRRVALDGATAEVLAVLDEADRRTVGAVTAERATVDTGAARMRTWGVEALRMALEGYAAAGPWGDRRLQMIAALHPRNSIILGYAAERALQRGQADSAARLYLVLVRREPTVLDWHRGRARAASAAGQPTVAAAAWVTVLELEPGDEPAFRALVGLSDVYPLEQQLSLFRRLRQRRPKEAVLRDREIELLQRLGRADEAQAVARPPRQDPA